MADSTGSLDLAVAIVSYHSAPELPACIAAVLAAVQGLSCEVHVVDNASADGSAAVARAAGAIVHEPGRNLGFGAAANVVSRERLAANYLVLNPDITVMADAIDLLMAAVREPGVVAAGPALFDPAAADPSASSGEDYYRREPTLLRALLEHTHLGQRAVPAGIRRRLTQEKLGTRDRDVEQIPGACLLVTRAALTDGQIFDESFPIWFEDVDFSTRMRQRGGRLRYVAQARAAHIGGASFTRWSGPTKEAMFFQSLRRWFRLHAPVRGRVLSTVIAVERAVLGLALIGRPLGRQQWKFLRLYLGPQVPLPGRN